MNCRAVRARLVPFQDDELSPGEATRVSEHLATCGPCRRLEARLAAATPRPEPIDVDTSALFARMDAELDRAWSRPAPRRPVLPAFRVNPALVAYAAILMLTAAWGAYNWRAARTLEVELAAARPVPGSVVPVRGLVGVEPRDLPAEHFAPAAFVPPSE